MSDTLEDKLLGLVRTAQTNGHPLRPVQVVRELHENMHISETDARRKLLKLLYENKLTMSPMDLLLEVAKPK